MFVVGVHTYWRAIKMCENALILAQNLGRATVGLYIKKKSHPFSPIPTT